MKLRLLAIACFVFLLTSSSSLVFAQEATPTATATPEVTVSPEPTATPSSGEVTNATEGISGYQDAKGRDPVIIVTAKRDAALKKATLLVDAYVSNGEFTQFPIRFDFYINRKLYVSQMRSVELPGPIGIDIGEDIATIPFNYSVVATVLHPNKQFSTILHGAVEESTGSGGTTTSGLDCTLMVTDSEGIEDDFVGNGVTFTSSDSDTWTFSFTADNIDQTASAAVSGSADVTSQATETGSSASSSVSVVIKGSTTKLTLTGQGTTQNGSLMSLDVSDENGNSLKCS